MTLSLARALAPAIRVNAVAPGFITGRWLQAGLGPDYDLFIASLEKKLPLGRVCDPDDIALAVTSLLEGSPLVTGQTLICDSGLTLGPSFL
jgi:3-oxoacyl-[acyl-carrier protein] reductase